MEKQLEDEITNILIAAQKDNCFVESMHELYIEGKYLNNLMESIVKLHNSNVINVLSELTQFSKTSTPRMMFSLFHDMLPQFFEYLDTPVVEAMDCIKHLISSTKEIICLDGGILVFFGEILRSNPFAATRSN